MPKKKHKKKKHKKQKKQISRLQRDAQSSPKGTANSDAKDSPTSVRECGLFGSKQAVSRQTGNLDGRIQRHWPSLREIFVPSSGCVKTIDWSQRTALVDIVVESSEVGVNGLDIIMDMVCKRFSQFFALCDNAVESGTTGGSILVDFAMIISYLSLIEYVLATAPAGKVVHHSVDDGIELLRVSLKSRLDNESDGLDGLFRNKKLMKKFMPLLKKIMGGFASVAELSHQCSVGYLTSHFVKSLPLELDSDMASIVDTLKTVGIVCDCYIKPSRVKLGVYEAKKNPSVIYEFALNGSGKGHQRYYKVAIQEGRLLQSTGLSIDECQQLLSLSKMILSRGDDGEWLLSDLSKDDVMRVLPLLRDMIKPALDELAYLDKQAFDLGFGLGALSVGR